ncbi:wall-associated receptor kinase-like 1 [Coffea arabica]|uniref:Wall-associated receptor kinase-like 1 n=1 Tax=Coffea arabica TaxID=13443 RepID=A0A6P6UB98_COFAR|nr:wall-associated receptor kinase-like 1 [Coffea arabica]
MNDLRFIHGLLLFLCLVVLSSAETRFPMAKPGCNDTCGNVTIPYPFGIGPDCALNEAYNIICTDVSGDSIHGLRPYLGLQPGQSSQTTMEVLGISLSDQTVTINYPVSQICSVNGSTVDTALMDTFLAKVPFYVSREHNKLMLLGCGNALLKLINGGPQILSGCTSMCNSTMITGCYGINCCQASIPYYLSQYSLRLTASQNFTSSTCAYAFLVDQNWKLESYINPPKVLLVHAPVVWSWPLNHSEIVTISGCSPRISSLELESSTIPTYQCECSTLGDDTWFYQVNPYLDGACKHAISEISGKGNRKAIITGTTVGAGMLILLITAFCLYNVVKKMYKNKRKEKFYRRMLRQQLSAEDIENAKLFTANELSKATDNFNENRILGQGGQGTVYKGMLNDGKIVAIKKAKNVNDSRFEEFVNELVILLQVNHRNVVKLLGCCLQSEVPLLVYEFIPNGTLYSLIHSQNDDEFPFTWNLRLRIATEITGALAYLHSDISVPILHRDIKSSNILLDEKYIAKVSDFGTSRSIEVDQTHLTTRVQGTFGYMDPEYFLTSQYTEKSDVYSFGVVLVELLTRQKPVSCIQTGEDVSLSLADRFLKSLNQNSLGTILDPELADERNEEEVIVVAKLAQRCLNSNAKARPTMKETHRELESVKSSKGDSAIHAKFHNPSCVGEEAVGISDSTCYTWTTSSDPVESPSDAYPFMYKTV